MEVIEAIRTRRSIRHYKPDAIPEEKLNAVLEAARWAPSWANTQCWRFIVVRDANVRAKLAETLGENPSAGAVRNAPVVIVACAALGVSGYYKGQPATDKGDWWYMFDVALAMQNLVLAAHSLGLGTVHIGLFDAGSVASILKIPEGFRVVEMTPLGYPSREGRPTPRRELSELVFHETFGQIE